MAGIFAVADAFWRCGGICMARIFAIADAFSLPVMYNCIRNLLIPRLADANLHKIASATYLFYNLQILPFKNGIFSLKQWQTARTACHLISFILFIKYHFVILSSLLVCHLQPVTRSHPLFRHFLQESVLRLMYQRVSADIV